MHVLYQKKLCEIKIIPSTVIYQLPTGATATSSNTMDSDSQWIHETRSDTIQEAVKNLKRAEKHSALLMNTLFPTDCEHGKATIESNGLYIVLSKTRLEDPLRREINRSILSNLRDSIHGHCSCNCKN